MTVGIAPRWGLLIAYKQSTSNNYLFLRTKKVLAFSCDFLRTLSLIIPDKGNRKYPPLLSIKRVNAIYFYLTNSCLEVN